MPDDFRQKSGANRAYRLGPGALASRQLQAHFARLHLLLAAEALYPAMREEIEALIKEAAGKETQSKNAAAFLEEARGFCRRWGLMDGKEPAGWAVRMIEDTVAAAARAGGRWPGWQLRWAEYVPAAPEGFEPDAETARQARAGMQKKQRAAARAALAAWRERGWEPVRSRRNRQVLEWAARHQFGGETWEEIASSEIGKVRAQEYAAAVKMQARELLRLAGLSRPPGRRRAT